MLFNSYAFIFGFLPLTLAVYCLLGQMVSARAALLWLTTASLFFYGWWDPAYLALLAASILFNFSIGLLLTRAAQESRPLRRPLLVFGVMANLGLLGYYKYSEFFSANLAALTGIDLQLQAVILPLGISFYTFTQIAYLVDAARGEAKEYNPISYSLFVTFFPHLIAGPIIHHRQVMPQFSNPAIFRFNHTNFAVGITFFAIGLSKKVVFADTLATYSSPVFAAAADGASLSAIEAWTGALAYTLQLYFDFSGYSDMAVGLSRMFGIILPFNFNSPYQAVNIIDFWRRWHMSLSAFLRDYLYFSLGGNRLGKLRRYINLLLTMLLGGLWHGAGWTFVVWGALHGGYLVVNHAWHALRVQVGFPLGSGTAWGRGIARLFTLLAVIVGWVFFRAESIDAALKLLAAMGGGNGLMGPETSDLFIAHNQKLAFARLTAWPSIADIAMFMLAVDHWFIIGGLLFVAMFAPNSQEWVTGRQTDFPRWRPSPFWASVTAAMLLLCVSQMSQVSEFLYFQF